MPCSIPSPGNVAVRESRSMCPATSRMSSRVLAVEIEYRQWTPYDRLRAPVFKGLAVDVPPESVTWETEGPEPEAADRGVIGGSPSWFSRPCAFWLPRRWP